jgi:hypothetical protein
MHAFTSPAARLQPFDRYHHVGAKLAACPHAHSADVDGCAANGACSVSGSSLANGTCIDAKAPSTGFSCGCITGATWSGNACNGERNKLNMLPQARVVPLCAAAEP